MDAATSTLLAASVGGLISLGTTWLNNYFSANREAKQWTKQQEAERDKRRHEEKKAELERRREMFHNALTHLSNLVSCEQAELSVPEEEQHRLIVEAQKWVNVLSLNENVNKTDFLLRLEAFIYSPLAEADNMRAAVIRLSAMDKVLFPDTQKSIKALPPADEPTEKGIQFQMKVDDDFRKQHLIEGMEVPQTYRFYVQLTDIAKSPRELLVNIYYPNSKGIPTVVQLPMPLPAPNPTQPYTSGHAWKGKLNPSASTPARILETWEHDYKEAFNKIYGSKYDRADS
jgi:hypothetical protein